MGPPDGGYAAIPGGTAIVLDLGLSPVVVDGDPDPDLVYYEREASGQIFLDLVIVEVGMTSDGEWFVVFNWGDQAVDTNTNVAANGADGEDANEVVPSSDLYGTPPYTTGITIDVDAVVSTPGVYGWVRITAPTPDLGPGDWAEVDAVEVLPTPIPTP